MNRILAVFEIIQDRFTDLRDGIAQFLCRHNVQPEYHELETSYEGKHHYSAFWECPRCDKVLKVEAQTFHRDPPPLREE